MGVGKRIRGKRRGAGKGRKEGMVEGIVLVETEGICVNGNDFSYPKRKKKARGGGESEKSINKIRFRCVKFFPRSVVQ